MGMTCDLWIVIACQPEGSSVRQFAWERHVMILRTECRFSISEGISGDPQATSQGAFSQRVTPDQVATRPSLVLAASWSGFSLCP